MTPKARDLIDKLEAAERDLVRLRVNEAARIRELKCLGNLIDLAKLHRAEVMVALARELVRVSH